MCIRDRGYGYGFALSYHQTLKKVKIAGTDYYQHTDGDGTVHYFYYDSKKFKWLEEGCLLYTSAQQTLQRKQSASDQRNERAWNPPVY